MTVSILPKATQLGDAVLARKQIASGIADLAQAIDKHYLVDGNAQQHAPLVLVPILKGALYFCADLSREVLTPHVVEPVTYRSYKSELRGDGRFVGLDNGAMESLDVCRGANVLVVDTIIDSGATYEAVRAFLHEYEPKSVELAVLIARSTVRQPRFVGFVHHGREFLYGYGLDLDDQARHLQAIYAK
jgi:hypoxanthine phosphoribosyltransferase